MTLMSPTCHDRSQHLGIRSYLEIREGNATLQAEIITRIERKKGKCVRDRLSLFHGCQNRATVFIMILVLK